MSRAPVILAYAPIDDLPAGRGRRRLALQLALCQPALAAPFLTFAYGTSPLDAAREVPWEPGWFRTWPLWLMGIGFFIAFPLLAWKLRQLVLPHPPADRELWWARLAALGCLAPVLGLLASLGWYLSEDIPSGSVRWQDASILSGALMILAAGLWSASRVNRRRRTADVVTAILVSAYVADVSVALMCFVDLDEIGWFTSLVAAVIGAGELIALAEIPWLTRWRLSRRWRWRTAVSTPAASRRASPVR
jgi:hypothetical protein